MISAAPIRLAPLLLALVAARGAALPTSTASGRRIQSQPPAGTCHGRGRGLLALPDPRCTPGAVNPAVTQSDIHSTICRSGFTERIRPSEWVTEAEKRAALREALAVAGVSAAELGRVVPGRAGQIMVNRHGEV